MRTGSLHQTTTGQMRDQWGNYRNFDEWRMYISAGWIYLIFRLKNGRWAKWTSPFNGWLKHELRLTDAEWKVFDQEFKILLERQKKKYPVAHKEQKSHTIKQINYRNKNWPKIAAYPEVSNWTKELLSICRKRS